MGHIASLTLLLVAAGAALACDLGAPVIAPSNVKLVVVNQTATKVGFSACQEAEQGLELWMLFTLFDNAHAAAWPGTSSSLAITCKGHSQHWGPSSC